MCVLGKKKTKYLVFCVCLPVAKAILGGISSPRTRSAQITIKLLINLIFACAENYTSPVRTFREVILFYIFTLMISLNCFVMR